ncbi:class I SAM-dependent methyltransferase [Roseibium sp. Sym1]|uniref:class I SAM-dependent methyltransferase n=1 Tax=Roseibium sp. Sym1 TaxID=3016006 RepID=UPI0022B3C955|nr:class I SAM-dependent methyltransferase [Roseibium sp. Sym1]
MDIQVHDNPAAAMWGSTGAAYDGISFGLSDTISHCVQMLWPRPAERILDIGTGTGWAARLAAQRGARVTGIDISPGMLHAAEKLSKGLDPLPDFLKAPAEALPFEDGEFDGLVSTYGIIFSGVPDNAIAEMMRVLRPGGRFALATWADETEGYIPRFFRLIASFSSAPPPPVSPFAWGNPDWLAAALGRDFAIATRKQTTVLYAPDAETVWQEYLKGFGPVAATHASLDGTGQAAFRDAFMDMHRQYATNAGLVVPRQAVLVKGTRL